MATMVSESESSPVGRETFQVRYREEENWRRLTRVFVWMRQLFDTGYTDGSDTECVLSLEYRRG